MLLDKLVEFDPAGTLMSAWIVGSNPSTNIFDLGMATGIPASSAGGGARDLGISAGGDGPIPKIMVMCLTTAGSSGNGTVNIQVQGAPDNGSGAPGTYTTYAESGVLVVASIVAGARLLEIDIPRPAAGAPLPRYIKLNYLVATAVFQSGAYQAELVLTRDDYPRGPAGQYSGYAPGIVINN